MPDNFVPIPERFAGCGRVELSGGLVLVAATSVRVRLAGVIGLASLDPRLGVELAVASVHTFGVRLDLDLLWLDRSRNPVRLDRDVPARRVRVCAAARSVIEVPAGSGGAFAAAIAAVATGST